MLGACASRTRAALKADLAGRVEEGIRGRLPGLVGRVRIDLPAHPSLSVVRQLLDPQGRNVALSDAASWKSRAGRELADPYRSRVLALPHEDEARGVSSHRGSVPTSTLSVTAVGVSRCITRRAAGAELGLAGA